MSRLNRKRGRKSNYVHSLNSDNWKELKRKVLVRDRRCVICGSSLYLETHHLHYRNKGNEKLEDLVLLCAKCHQKVHNDKYHKFNPVNN